MSLHIILLSENVSGHQRRQVFDISFVGAYPADGEPLSARRLMLSYVSAVQIPPVAGFSFVYDRLTARLHVFGLAVLGSSTDDIAVFFTEPGDPLGSPAKVPAGSEFDVLAQSGEVAPGTDLSALQHVQLTVEGY